MKVNLYKELSDNDIQAEKKWVLARYVSYVRGTMIHNRTLYETIIEGALLWHNTDHHSTEKLLKELYDDMDRVLNSDVESVIVMLEI